MIYRMSQAMHDAYRKPYINDKGKLKEEMFKSDEELVHYLNQIGNHVRTLRNGYGKISRGNEGLFTEIHIYNREVSA